MRPLAAAPNPDVHPRAPAPSSFACSVIIPAYNVEGVLREAIESLLGQRTSYPFEIIVVDDGSSDGTVAVARSYGDAVRVICKANGGPSSARNLGVQSASAELILFLDGDDRALPGRIERQVCYLLENPDVDVCFGNFEVETDPSDYLQTYGLKGSHSEFRVVPDAFARLLVRGSFVPTSASAVRKKAYIANGMQPEDMRYAEDYALWCRIAAAGGRFAFTQAPLAWYRCDRQGRLTTSAHTYLGPVAVLRDNLIAHGDALAEADRAAVAARLCSLAQVLLRHDWIVGGRRRVVSRLEELQVFLPVRVQRKWERLALIPPWVPRGARYARHRCENLRQMLAKPRLRRDRLRLGHPLGATAHGENG